jgi:DNA-binding transcriptional LysR family regulator
MGLAALPRYVAEESINTGAVDLVLKSWSLPSQEIHAVFPSPRLLPTKVQTFIDWLQSEMSDNWWTQRHLN